MRILLLNKNPIISKLVRLSAQKLEYEFDEQASYADTLPQYDVIVVDDGVGVNLKDLESKCKKLICISSGETNIQSNPKILHKPFLPTDLIALMRDDEKAQPQEEQQEQEQSQNTSNDNDAPLDLDSLSFDSPTPDENIAQQNPSEEDNNIYLQDIKEEDSAQESQANEQLNSDALNIDSLAQEESISPQTPEQPNTNDTDNLTTAENTAQDENNVSGFTFDDNSAQNLGDNVNLDFVNTDINAQTLENNVDLSNLNNETTENAETPADTATQMPEEQEKEDDGLSLEPIEFIETQLPSFETTSQDQIATHTEQETSTTHNVVQEQTTNITQDEPITSESAQLEDAQDQELEFDTKDIADIMGLDEQTIQDIPIDTPIEPSNTQENTPKNENVLPDENTTDILNTDDNQENNEIIAQTPIEQENANEIPGDEPVSQENSSEANDEHMSTEQENEQTNETQSADETTDIEAIQATHTEQETEIIQNIEQDSIQNEPIVGESTQPQEAQDQQISEVKDPEAAPKETENTQLQEQIEPNAEDKEEIESESESAQIQEEQDEHTEQSEPTLNLDLENANFLQPLNEQPFSIEEKEEGKISFDDLPEDAQFLGQNKEENVEADEMRPVLVDEPKAQSTQDMVKEQLAALDAMDSQTSEMPASNSAILEDLQGISERDLQLALGEVPQDEANTTLKSAESPNTDLIADEPQNSALQNKINTQDNEVIDELSKGISGAIASSIKDDALKAALKGMNMHIDINIKFDEDKT